MTLRHSNALRQLVCRIDVSAFAAVMFVLVAAFLVRTASYRDLPRDSTDAVKASHAVAMPAALREDVLEVAITRDSRIFLGGEQVSTETLPAAIREGLHHGAERKVYIRADRRARYGSVKQALDAVHSAGIENVAFLVDGYPQRDPIERQH